MKSSTRSSTKSRKQSAKTFLALCATGKVDQAYQLVAADFRHHNPYFKGDAASLKAAMADAARKFPRTGIEFQRAIEEGSLVAVHSKVTHEPSGRAIAVGHIFRFKGERIVELWDVAMEEPEDSPNEQGMF
jgi:predicted SnoaL-like aldol condensation-catalyzing enzyme